MLFLIAYFSSAVRHYLTKKILFQHFFSPLRLELWCLIQFYWRSNKRCAWKQMPFKHRITPAWRTVLRFVLLFSFGDPKLCVTLELWMFGLSVFKNLCWKSINKKEYLHTEFNKSFDKILSKSSNLIQRRSKEAVSFSQVMEQWGCRWNWGHLDVCNERGAVSPNNFILLFSENSKLLPRSTTNRDRR